MGPFRCSRPNYKASVTICLAPVPKLLEGVCAIPPPLSDPTSLYDVIVGSLQLGQFRVDTIFDGWPKVPFFIYKFNLL